MSSSNAGHPAHSTPQPPQLIRQIGLGSAVSLNMLNMIGVGPFIAMPLVIIAMGGPQAMLGWVLGALIAICDGMVWSELGAAMPKAGGSYAFLREIYGANGAGRLFSFLYVWQVGFSAPLSIASGCIGLSQYAAYLWPPLAAPVFPSVAGLSFVHFTNLAAASVCTLVVILLYRNVQSITRMAWVLWIGVVFTICAVILAGFTHFHPALAFTLPPGAFRMDKPFFEGLGAATLLATYCYWGYYNVSFLGAEIKDPGRNIPRAVLLSVLLVAALYLSMNLSVLGVVPWRDLRSGGDGSAKLAVVAVVMQKSFGPLAARAIAALVMWCAFASVFSVMLGYSRVPYAAALDGNYFRFFARLHPVYRFPNRSLLALGAVATFFCFFDLPHVIAALVAIRIVLQFLLQQVGVILLRIRQPQMPRPFRIWLYPLPPVLAFAGFLFILISRHQAMREFSYAAVVALSGTAIFLVRSYRRGEWPFAGSATSLPDPQG
jgi:amino acid transporter